MEGEETRRDKKRQEETRDKKRQEETRRDMKRQEETRRDKNRKVFWWGNLEDRSHLEGLDGDGGIILKLILMRWDWRSSTGIIRLGMGTNEQAIIHSDSKSMVNNLTSS
jgi:hypothetical protein